jgi:hypothetical protein
MTQKSLDNASFRPARFHAWLAWGSFAVAVGLAVLSFTLEAPTWQRVTSIAFLIGTLAAIAEVATRRLVLSPAGVSLVSNFRRRVVPRADIESVTWEKGSGVSLKLMNGRWVALPEVGGGNQALTNSIRAWIRRTAQ